MAKTEEKKKPPDEEGPRSFARVLELLDGGAAHSQLSADLQHLGITCKKEAVAQNGKVKAKLTFTLTMEVEPRDDTVALKWASKVQEPTRKTGGSIFWLTKGGNLSREAPKQLSLSVRVVETDGEARDVGAEADAKEI